MSEEKTNVKGSWTTNDATGMLTHTFKSQNNVTFDLTKVFPLWADLTPTQKRVIDFGFRKKIANSVALDSKLQTTEEEKIKLMTDTFNSIIDGKWSTRMSKSDIEKAIALIKKSTGIILTEGQIRAMAKEVDEVEEG